MALLHINSYSNILGRSIRIDAVLPESAPRPWKCLLLLHGLTDDHTAWQRFSSIERYAMERGIAVLMPTTKLGFYTNTCFSERYYDFIFGELPALCRRMLPNLSKEREDNYIAGLSMGGYGALKGALTKPEHFCKAAAFSAAADVHALSGMPLEGFHLKESFYQDIFGPAEGIPGSGNDLFAAAERLEGEKPGIYMWCGTEDDLYAMNLRMRDHLKELGYDVAYSESPGGHHWMHWDREIKNALDWMLGKEEWEWL